MNGPQNQIQALIDEMVESGPENGVQAAVYRHGDLVVDAGAGLADPETGRPVTSDTLFSCSPIPSAYRPFRRHDCGAVA